MITMRSRSGIGSMMMKLSFVLLFFSIVLFSSPCNAKLSDKRLCYDKDCSVVVSTGVTALPYNSKDHDVLSFPPSTDVKIFSKSAGSRMDLWGVEIQGKRGYAPLKFIRETKIYHGKLEHIVPTDQSISEPINDINKKLKKQVDSSIGAISNNAQTENIQKEISLLEFASENFKETIKPDEVVQTYDSIYDGTLIPQYFADVQASEPNYSTRTLLNTVEKEEKEEVKLNVYPNIISSTFSALSGILGGADNSAEESVQVLSSESVVIEATTEKTPEIEEADESSLHAEEKHTVISKETVPQETLLQGAESEETLPQEKVSEKVAFPAASSEESVLPKEEVKEIMQDRVVPETASEKVLTQKTVTQKIESEEALSQESAVPEAVHKQVLPLETVAQETDSDVKQPEIIAQETDSEVKQLEVSVKETDSEVKQPEIIAQETDSEVKQPEIIAQETDSEVKQPEIIAQETDSEVKHSEIIAQETYSEVKQPEIIAQETDSEVKQPGTIVKELTAETQQELIQENVTKIIPEKDEVSLNINTNETNSSEKKVVDESVNQSNIVKQNEKSKNVIPELASSVDTSFDKKFFIKVQEEIKTVSDDLVPKQKKPVTITDGLVITENKTGIETSVEQTVSDKQKIQEKKTSVEQTVLDKQKVEEQETSVNSANVEESITSKVPLNEELIPASSESFIPPEEPLQPNLSNESLPFESEININVNLTTPEVFTKKESNTTDDTLNLEKNLETSDNTENSNINNIVDSYTTSVPTYPHNDSATESSDFQTADSSHEPIAAVPSTPSFGEFLGNRNLLNAGKSFQHEDYSEEIGVGKVVIDEKIHATTSSGINENLSNVKSKEEQEVFEEIPLESNIEKIVIPADTCDTNFECSVDHEKVKYTAEENAVTGARKMADNSETLLYVCITAVTTLLFSLGYYFIENRRRDAYLIGKINNLEKDLMITRKECIMLDENFKSTKTKLDSIEDESFGSNEMVLSLKDELTSSENTRAELEDQIASLEKELESTSEAGLELERMLREILSTQSEENNPLAQSIEDLQERLNNQQVANESLQNALAIKTQENETLTADLTVSLKKVEQLQAEVKKLGTELRTVTSAKINLEQTLVDQIQQLEIHIKSMTDDNSHLRKQIRMKELELKELLGVIEQVNANSIDYEKIYEVSQIKAEANRLLEERDELKIKLSEEEGAHQLLEEHVKVVKEEVTFLSEQCKVAEKEKKDAETRLEVLTKFFEEKEAQRQKEEALWLQKQGEVSSTVERLQTMQNEILHYKQQIEMLRREIVDQEREYKNQISVLETKAHEHWVAARQNERRLEEVKAESSQLRNRLTLVEKNINEVDPEVKLHRLREIGQNGETGSGALNHQLFPGGETSSSPLMFGGGVTGPVPPLPPPPLSSYHHHHHMFPPPPLPGFMPPPPPPAAGSSNVSASNELVGSRPPPLGGGRLSSPPPHMPPPSSSNSAVSPPPLSPPPALMPFPPHLHHPSHHPTHHPHPLHPPLPPYASDVPPLLLPRHHPHNMPPPPLSSSSQQQQQERGGHTHNSNWGDDNAVRNTSAGYNIQQRDQRSRNHKGSLHSSGESLDKSHHGGKV